MPQLFRIYKDEETTLKVYQRRLRMADKMFDKSKPNKMHAVDRYDNFAEEDQFTSRGHRVSVTKGIGLVDTMFANMTAVNVEFIVNNVGHGTQQQAIVTERALNQMWKDTKGQKRAKRAIKDALLVDIGWVKVYYDYVEDTELRDVPEEALKAQLVEVFGDKAVRGELTDADVAAAVDDGTLQLVEDVDIVLRDRVCVDHVDWEDIRFDPSAKYIEDVRWMAQYTKMPLQEVRQHPQWRAFVLDRYGEREGKRLLDDVTGDTSILTGLEGNYSDIAELGADDFQDDVRVTVVEYWDFETGLVTTFPKDNTELVLYERLNPLMFNLDYEDRNPFKPLVVRDTPSKLEGNGDMNIIMPALEEADEYRRNISQYVSRNVPKVFGPSRALTTEGKKALNSQEWMEYVGLEEGITFQELGSPPLPPLPEQATGMLERIDYEMEEATGANEPMRGIFPSKSVTATETQIVTGKGEERQSERRDELTLWYTNIARTAMQLMQIFYDRERIMRYTDDLGNEFAWEWTNEDIALDADLEISLTPKENLTRDQRFQRALGFMNLALPLPETDRGELLRWVAREMGLRDDTVASLVKSDEEVKMEAQQEQIQQQLAVQPQPFANSPPGLGITPQGGG